MYLFLAFLLVPMIEITLFIQVGSLIGLWPTLGIVVLTAVLGITLVRSQGRMALGKLQQSFSALNDPTEPLAHGAMILISGVLLVTPGFFTDTIGFLLLIPSFRSFAFRELRKRIKVQGFVMGQHTMPPRQDGFRDQPGDPTTIDGEWQEIDQEGDSAPNDPQAPSGWTRH